ncbi:aldolase/citrate lyase family protein [Roseibium salinum]|nr:aldolase/citrate lyase family protein [Roseibium salinum]
MIETQEGLAALEEIASVPGLDGIYIGPADLSLSHGLAPGFDRQEPEMRTRIDRIRDVCHSKGLRCALHCGTVEYALEAAEGGMDLVTVGSDARFIEQSSQIVCSKFRDRIGSTDAGGGTIITTVTEEI